MQNQNETLEKEDFSFTRRVISNGNTSLLLFCVNYCVGVEVVRTLDGLKCVQDPSPFPLLAFPPPDLPVCSWSVIMLIVRDTQDMTATTTTTTKKKTKKQKLN